MADRPLCVVTGASAGIGRELARIARREEHDVILCADQEKVREVAEAIGEGAEAVVADLSTEEGVDALLAAIGGRRVAVLCANAGRGLGGAFLDQEWREARHVIDTNVTGTLYLIHQVGRAMRAQGGGRILVTGSIAGYIPGSFQAVYNGTKALVDSFCGALADETRDQNITVTCLMPGVTETEFFERAGMADTAVGSGPKDDPADVAETGWAAMLRGDAMEAHGLKNKLQTVLANVTPGALLARQHRKGAEPGSGQQ